MKAAFYPKLDCLLFADYSQIEYRIYAWYMAQQIGDETAANWFREGKDLHEETAIRVMEALGLEIENPLPDSDRQKYGKVNNFSALYAGGIPTIIRWLGCDAGTARAISEAFHSINPLLGRWKWQGNGFVDPPPETLNGVIVQVLQERGYLRTLWGRHLHPASARHGLNGLCQGGAADLMKKAMVSVARETKDMESHMVLSVHDEIGLDCVDHEVDYIRENIRDWMGEPILEEVLPIDVDIKVSHGSWAEAAE